MFEEICRRCTEWHSIDSQLSVSDSSFLRQSSCNSTSNTTFWIMVFNSE